MSHIFSEHIVHFYTASYTQTHFPNFLLMQEVQLLRQIRKHQTTSASSDSSCRKRNDDERCVETPVVLALKDTSSGCFF